MKGFPNALVVILGVIVLAWVLTYIIPQGEFEDIPEGIKVTSEILDGAYHTIEAENPSFFDLLLSIPRGIKGRATVIVLIFLLGGCFYVIEKTGALSEGLNKLTAVLDGKETLALIIVSAIFTAAGAAIGLQEEVIALMPVLLVFGKSLGYNVFTVIAMSYGSTVVGSSFSPSNPFAVIIAQKEAGLPLLSGSEFRLTALVIAFVIWVVILIAYNRNNSVPKLENTSIETAISKRSTAILLLLSLTFGIVVYGLLNLDWGFNEMSACFFALGIVAGPIGKLKINGTAEAYVAGCKEMVFAALIIGLANSISLILQDGKILDTIVLGLFGPLENLPVSLSAVLMMISHTILHFPIPNYSGQAILTMPILIPLSDLIGLSRQMCVLVYQYGAVIPDLFAPTNGALMAVLAVSGVTYDKWIKFIWKPALLVLLFAIMVIGVGILIGY